MIIFNSGFSTEVNCTFLHIPHPTRLRDDPKDLSKSVGQQNMKAIAWDLRYKSSKLRSILKDTL